MPVVAGPGQALRRDRPVLGPRPGLQDVEQAEAHRLLDLGVTVHLDVGAVPELVQVGPLLGEQAVPAGQVGGRQRPHHLVDEGGPGPLARPAVADELDDLQLLAGSHLGRHREPAQVGVGLDPVRHLRRAGDHVRHSSRDPQPAGPRPVHQQRAGGPGVVGALGLLADQRVLQDGGQPGVLAPPRQFLVRDDLGLQHEPQLRVHRLDRVADRRDGALRQRHHPHGRDLDPGPGRGGPVHLAGQRPRPQVQHALVRVQRAVPDVERLVVHEQPDDLAVGDVDGGLPGVGEAVAGLRVRQRPNLVHRVQIAAGQPVGVTFVEVAAQPDVSVRQGEDRLALRQDVQVEPVLDEAPGLRPVR